MRKDDGIEMASVTALKSRGWSRAMVDNILGEPDKLAQNPRYASGSPVRLYAVARVCDAENQPAFKIAHQKAIKRSQQAQQRSRMAVAALQADIANSTFEVMVLEAGEVQKRAIRSFNDRLRYSEHGGDTEAATTSTTDFLERITVNYIRHHLTQYDEVLSDMLCRRLGWQALPAVRARCFAAIASAYPHLAAACDRQLNRKQHLDEEIAAYRNQNRYLTGV